MKNINIHTILMSIILFMLPSGIYANAYLTIEHNISSYTNFKVDYYMDALDSNKSIKDISDSQHILFKEQISNAFSLGYNQNNFWFHLSVYNSSKNKKEMVLELTEIFHKHVDLFVIGDSMMRQENGLNIPIKSRRIQEPTPSFPIEFLPYEKKEVYLKISSIYALFGAIEFKTKLQYQKDIQTKKYLYIIYLTIILTLTLYNLILFFFIKEKKYLLYIVHIVIFIIWFMNYKGILLPYINMKIYDNLQITVPLAFIFFTLFSQFILETKKLFPLLNKILNIFIGLSFISIIWMQISMHIGFQFMNIVTAPLLPLLLYIVFLSLSRYKNIAKIYLIGLATYLIGIGLLTFLALGILPYSKLLSHSVMIGSLFEVVFFSFLIVYKINIVREESIKTQNKLTEQQKTESTRLFHNVGEKTKELHSAKKELENELTKKQTLEKHLKHLASTDPLTELLNRRAFFEISDAKMLIASDNKSELSCLVIDIDHFKTVNDTYGHDTGDRVITTLSKMFIDNTRDTDIVGRIGGEEFAVLMPNTDRELALEIADRLRENVSKHKIVLTNKAINITISIGLSSIHHQDESIHTIIKRADTALYKAKKNGRNQVCTI